MFFVTIELSSIVNRLKQKNPRIDKKVKKSKSYSQLKEKKKNSNKKIMSPTLNLKSDWKAALPVVDFHPRIFFSIGKFLSCGWPTLM